MPHHERHGAKQPERFDPARAQVLDDPSRFIYLPAELVLDLLDAPENARIVDFGTGTGAYAVALAQRRPDLEIVALDEQPQMLDLLRAKLNARPQPSVELADDPRPLEGTADRVLALNVLHELGDEALAELSKLVKPGGYALFIDWNADADRPVGPPNDHVYTLDEAEARVRASGLNVMWSQTLAYHFAIAASA